MPKPKVIKVALDPRKGTLISLIITPIPDKPRNPEDPPPPPQPTVITIQVKGRRR